MRAMIKVGYDDASIGSDIKAYGTVLACGHVENQRNRFQTRVANRE